jgi:hypothetical protein
MFLEDREVVCPAGSFIFIPQGARHGFCVGEVPSRKLNFYFPASMIGYFEDLAEALRRDSVTEGELGDIAEAHGMEIVGPPAAVRLALSLAFRQCVHASRPRDEVEEDRRAPERLE